MKKLGMVDTLVIPALGKRRKLNQESKVVLSYLVNSKWDPTSKQQSTKNAPGKPLPSSASSFLMCGVTTGQEDSPRSPSAWILYHQKWKLRIFQKTENSIILEMYQQRVATHFSFPRDFIRWSESRRPWGLIYVFFGPTPPEQLPQVHSLFTFYKHPQGRSPKLAYHLHLLPFVHLFLRRVFVCNNLRLPFVWHVN